MKNSFIQSDIITMKIVAVQSKRTTSMGYQTIHAMQGFKKLVKKRFKKTLKRFTVYTIKEAKEAKKMQILTLILSF